MMEVGGMSEEDMKAAAARLGFSLYKIYRASNSITLPGGEDFGVVSDDEEWKSERMKEADHIELDEDFGNIIVVDNLPVVSQDKFEKLQKAIIKLYDRLDVLKHIISMPVDPQTHKTLGYCFVECRNRQEAELAKQRTHGYRLDKSHRLSVNMLDDIDKFSKVPEEWAPPETTPYTPGENLQKWLMDEKCRDQFVIRAGNDTEVLWNDARQLGPELAYKRSDWTESFVQWSPLGTYLATLHKQGVAVWGGATTFNRLVRYHHSQVKLIDFSPGEKYLVTYSIQEPEPYFPHILFSIFDVRTGTLMRDFRERGCVYASGPSFIDGVSWPIFRWGGGKEDKYFARIGKMGRLSVYETETFALIDKKSIDVVNNVADFSWSPTDSILAFFVSETYVLRSSIGRQPPRVSLVQIPSKQELRRKDLFCVSDCKFYWQSNGDYLAVKVDRYTDPENKKKTKYSGVELFRIKERGIPIESLELENKNDKIVAFAWEPKGHRFAVIHGNNDVSFYSMCSGRVARLTTIKGKMMSNALYWCPAGRFIVVAGIKGHLVFYNVDDLETMAETSHFMARHVEWDPSGRYVVTARTTLVRGLRMGFDLWTFDGKPLYRKSKDQLFQVSWRPRPPCLLTAEKEEEIAKNLDKYIKKYKADDEQRQLARQKQNEEEIQRALAREKQEEEEEKKKKEIKKKKKKEEEKKKKKKKKKKKQGK